MRKVKAWLVTEVTDWGGVFGERHVAAFQRREMAERCMETRDRRSDGAEYSTWNEIHEIEVVMDDD